MPPHLRRNYDHENYGGRKSTPRFSHSLNQLTLREDDGSVNIYADNDLIAWFDVKNNQIVLHRSFPVKNRDAFLLDADGYLDVRL